MESPYSTYQTILPYTCTFTIPDDGNKTEVIITTKSQSIFYGRNEQDIEFQLELGKKHSKPTYAKHILKYISNQLYSIDPKDVVVEYDSPITITQMTDEEIDAYRNECLEDE